MWKGYKIMKITYKKLMHVACGQSLALGWLEAYLGIFNEFITKYANTEQLNEKNIRDFLKIFKKETKIAIKDNNMLIEIADDLKN